MIYSAVAWCRSWCSRGLSSHHALAEARPRGYIEHLPSGSYRVIVPIERDPLTGKRRRLRETCATLDQAKVALTKLQRQVDEGKHPKSAISVREALQQWLEVAKLGVTTREQYDDLIRLYINPTLGEMPAGKVDAELLERFYSRLLRCKHLCSGRPPKGHVCRPLGPAAFARSTTSCGQGSPGRFGGGISRSIRPSWLRPRRRPRRVRTRRRLRRPQLSSTTPGAIPNGDCCCG